ncbi:MAG: amino acid permease [Phenylobacterium sp.]|uniref:amino acid permease n=1 Tax=Phenylobacterium sp. TaxID=1871053 RepID=UPI001A583DF6|nr:amino acid permease [Phenylobacterium sp.]MBL8553535.1 amino acid permease [Phenylobacterium sp.]
MAAANETSGVADRHGRIGVLGAAALVAGSMIGSGVYLLPATLAATGSISILGWFAAGLAALAIAGVFIWLAILAPEARGLGDYVRAGLGRFFGTQTVVLFWVSVWVGMVPLALAAAGAIGFVFPALQPPGARLAVTIAVIWAGVLGAWGGPRLTARIEGLTLAAGLAPVLLIAALGGLFFRPEVFQASWNPHGAPLGEALRSSALSCFWAFLGLESAAAAAAVVRDPARNVPRATLLGVLGTAALYIAASVAVMGLLPAAQLAGSTAPFADAARAALGAGLGALIAICAAVRATGCLASWSLIMAETTRTAADGGIFPRLFRTRPGEHASTINLVTAGGLMTVTAFLTAAPNLAEQFSTLINVVSLLSLYTYLLAALSLLRVMRGQPIARRAAAGLTAALACAAALVLIASGKPSEIAWSLAPIGLAAVLYVVMPRR